MSSIRRQSILSSIIIYIGFAVGACNVYLFSKAGFFTPEQYGLSSTINTLAIMMHACAVFGMPTFIFKFHPYYQAHLAPHKNDMPAIALTMGVLGFLIVWVVGWAMEPLVVRKFSANSPQLVNYYAWVFPMTLGYVLFVILEAFTWSVRKPIATSFLKEVLWRLFTSVLIVLFITGVIKEFGTFIKLYSTSYLFIAGVLIVFLLRKKLLYFSFSLSKVTKRYSRKIISLCIFSYSSVLVFTFAKGFDTVVIAAVVPEGLANAAIFTLAQFSASVIQAPQRGIVASSVAALSKAWKEKEMKRIQTIYQRSSINLLIFALGIFTLIALNYPFAIPAFGMNESYALGFLPFILIGLATVIEVSIGVNTYIIATSTYWRFDLISGIILLCFMLPTSYFLAKQFGIIGPSFANLISMIAYSTIRILFLWRKFKIQPYSLNTVWAILIAAGCFILCWFLFQQMEGIVGIVLRSVSFVLIYAVLVIYTRLSPDVLPVWQTIKNRMGIKK